MTFHAKEVLTQALGLSPIERAELVEQILASFEFSDREEIDRRWAVEAEARLKAYDEGLMGSTPAEVVFEEIEREKRK